MPEGMLRTSKEKLLGLRRTLLEPPEASHPWIRAAANQQKVPSSLGYETPWDFRQPLLALGQLATGWLGHSRRKRPLKNGEHSATLLPFVFRGPFSGNATAYLGR